MKKKMNKTIMIIDTKNKQNDSNKNPKHAQNEIKYTQK